MIKIISTSILILLISGCAQTENGLVFGVPDYEKRDIKVSQQDLEILKKVKEILSKRDAWSKDSVRVCQGSDKYSIYCALEKASKEVLGKYIHRQAALQEVRFVIDDHYKERWKVHRLADFNSHPDTTFEDINIVITKAMEKVSGKLCITRHSS